jgi:cytochrome oxidase Cu insertion factor (SCO1/SenC/PrrC family)
VKNRSLLAAVVVVCLAAQALPAQQTPPSSRTIDVSKLGPQVGQTIPDFRLKDQSGREWTRQSILGPKGAMIVFYRSADW